MSEGHALTTPVGHAGNLPAATLPERKARPAVNRATRAAQLHAAPPRQYGAMLSLVAVGAALYFGWHYRLEQHLTAESGMGYVLGIVGAVMMLLLLVYPMRKRMRSLRWIGATKHWFRIHMILGVLGPALIMFHSNFSLGSLNSRVALISMLLVAGSGLIGRYIYSKIHYSLYGGRMTMEDLRDAAEDSSNRLGVLLSAAPELQERLRAYERTVLVPPRSIFHGTARLLLAGFRARAARRAARRIIARALKRQAADSGWGWREKRRHAKEAKLYLASYFATARRVVGLGFYERLFALWHVLHVPLFIVLVITAIAHVLAVHMY